MKDESLLAQLVEDTGSEEEAIRLLPIIRRLQASAGPLPLPQASSRLMEYLAQFLVIHRHASLPSRLHFAWLVLRGQLRVIQHEIWAASAVVLGLGMLVTLATSQAASPDVSLPFVLMAPLAAAAGIAFLYGPAVDPALEIELALPVSPRQLLTARLALVFGFDLLIGLAGSALLSLLRAEVSFWPLVSTWLAPMTFLASLAFLLVTLTLDSGIALMACLAMWILQNLSRLIYMINLPFHFPDLASASFRPWFWLMAVVFGGAALWLAGREERWLGQQA
jgi:hypothetical protein